MKLHQRSLRYQIALALPILLFGTAVGYAVVNAVVTAQVDEGLEREAANIARQLAAGERAFATSATDAFISVVEGNGIANAPKDTTLFDREDGEDMPWRVGRDLVHLPDGSTFTITVGRSLVETEDLVLAVALSMALLLALMTAANVWLSRWLAQWLWRPFHVTLNALEQFELDATRATDLPSVDIDEFATMNRTIAAMTERLRSDFTAQKRFTERAAHELQTPLAIMQGKLDELIQLPGVGEREADVISGLFQARERMGRTLSNLLLLARIENQQFKKENVDWAGLVQEQRTALHDLMEAQGLRCTVTEEQPCSLRLHPVLAEVLIANLMRNAVKHNVPNGTITITLGPDAFVIANTGAELSVPPGTLFDRFAKGDPSSASTGLGLSMVKEIADRSGLLISYEYAAGTHTVVVRGNGATN